MDGVEYESDCKKQEVNEKDSENQVNIFQQKVLNDLLLYLLYTTSRPLIS